MPKKMPTLTTFLVSSFLLLSSRAEVSVPISRVGSFKNEISSAINELRGYAEAKLAASGEAFSPDPNYPYWNIFPGFIASAFASDNAENIRWTTPCFSGNEAQLKFSEDGTSVILTVTSFGDSTDETAARNSEHRCEDFYQASSTSAGKDFSVKKTALSSSSTPVITEVSIDLPIDITDAERWDIENKGMRLMRYKDTPATVFSNLLITLDLFKPLITGEHTTEDCEHNRNFINTYTNNNNIVPIDPSSVAPPDESEVHSGDLFALLGLDGLSTMLAWAMGTTTGHTTTALWIEDELNVCESNSAGAWPVNGVQCTPYQEWLQLVKDEGHQAVWAPLSPQMREQFNATAALEFFRSVEGLDYGYRTLIWPWLDKDNGNMPCLPPDYSSNCASWEFFEPLLGQVDRKFPQVGATLWNAGLAKRLGVSDQLRTSELLQIASQPTSQGGAGITSAELINIPEQDEWVYNTTRYGEPAVGQDMVCCVFVCNMWKAAGVFGSLVDDINCGEQTNWDVYVLTILDPQYRQIIGNYSLELQFDYNSRTPYPHMGENCPGLPPNYPKTPHC